MKSRRITAVVRGIVLAVAAAFSQAVLDDVTSVAVEQEKPAKLPDWVTMPDPEFCETYYKEATGTQEQSSRFAWRLFARLNQHAIKEEFSTQSGQHRLYKIVLTCRYAA